MRFFGILVLLLILVGVGFVYWNFFFVYSEGNREGVLYKFSTKGTFFKTNEGELLLPGVVPTMNQLSNNFFYFSCVDPVVTKKLERNIGKKINVHYKQYNSSLPWRGDNYNAKNREKGQYLVDAVEVIGEADNMMGQPAQQNMNMPQQGMQQAPNQQALPQQGYQNQPQQQNYQQQNYQQQAPPQQNIPAQQ